MNFIKSSLISLVTALTVASPSLARVEDGTADLLKTLDQNGVEVIINGPRCKDAPVHGMYSFTGMRRVMNLCPGSSVDAVDHDTVRHETAHAIQHCVNTERGTPLTDPIASLHKLRDMVNEFVPAEIVTFVKDTYPEDHWLVEFEAQLMSRIFTATELEEMFLMRCTAR